jgi:hypothetical protein
MYSDHYEPAVPMKKSDRKVSTSSSSGGWYRPIACVTREDYLKASDSLTYNLTIVYTRTAYHALHDDVASSVDSDSDHHNSQADGIVTYLQTRNMSTDNVMVIEYDSHGADNDRLLLLSLLTGFDHNGSDAPEYAVLNLNSADSSSRFNYSNSYHKMKMMEKISIHHATSGEIFIIIIIIISTITIIIIIIVIYTYTYLRFDC